MGCTLWYINIDPENHQFLMENSLPTPMTARVYVNLPEGNGIHKTNLISYIGELGAEKKYENGV